jgi:hypothetical protein
MPLAWSRLEGIRDYIPAAEVGVSFDRPVSTLPLIGESPQSMDRFGLKDWFQIGPQQFIKVIHDKYRYFTWAASDGALAYILTNDVFFDDGVTAIPPAELLPDGRSFDWCSVVRIGQDSGGVVCDIDFYSQRRVSFGRHTFYYRHVAPAIDEAPICIRVIPKAEPSIEAQQIAAANSP